ncbi:MAG: GspH/FimT family protein, partial [Phycisphaerae bacterium]|nr:GspH/FimT family protein [Phycisphaerae bacterium]
APGLSLVEITLVVAIVAVVSAVALPRFGGSNADARLRAAALRVERDVALARQHAVATSKPVTISFSSSGYAIPGLTSLDRRAATYTASLSEEPFRVTLTMIKFGSGNTLTFDMHGTPSSNGTLQLTTAGRNVTLLIDDQIGRVTRP